MPELPRGTVTFLFTDIAGSTRLWQGHRAAMEAAYARHDALLRDAVGAQGGSVYKVIGDALQVAFPSAPGALAATLAAQRALQAENWTAFGLPEPVRVRMALHTGAVDPDGDGDYRSPVLNRLGRLLGAGHGGQVLLSTVTSELARDSLPEGAFLQDLGEGRLKDLARPEHIYQLGHPELIADFPPLLTLERQAHNLPVQPTPLIGREREVEQLTGLLRQSEVRLVTLTGPGGTGKTRLALQAAAEVVEHVPDGVWFVELQALTDSALVPGAIAEVLGIRETGGTLLTELLADDLREKELLLVLDNLEQLLPEAAPGIGTLLSTAPGLTVLATSRVPLRVRAEREVAVPPLGLPRRKPPPTLAQLGQYEAVRLFLARAGAVKADFVVTGENAPAIAEICHRLDGLPLAIELAAARVRMFPPEAMLRRLEQRLPLLTGGARDLPLRQQTLKGAIAWSYELLSSDEQALFRRLSVFAGGFTIEAIETVAAGDELGLEVFDGLERLVEHSLVRQVEAEGEPRFTMLETIREYGLEQLEAAGEVGEAHTRHAAFFLDLVEEAAPALRGPEQGAWGKQLETEHDNLRAVLAWSLEHEPETALRLAGVLGQFWWLRGHLQEGQDWLEQALTAAPAEPSETQARALYAAGYLADHLGQVAQAKPRYEQVLATGRKLGDAELVSLGLHGLGKVADDVGQMEEAIGFYEEALALNRARGDRREVAAVSGNMGLIAARQGDIDRATSLNEETLSIYRELGDKSQMVYGLVYLSQFQAARQNFVGSMLLIKEGLSLAQAIEMGEGIVAEALASAGLVAAATDQHLQAARLLGAAEEFFVRIGGQFNPILPKLFDEAIIATRTVLGEEAYAAHHDAGGTLPLEDAISEALGVAEEIAGRVAPRQE